MGFLTSDIENKHFDLLLQISLSPWKQKKEKKPQAFTCLTRGQYSTQTKNYEVIYF